MSLPSHTAPAPIARSPFVTSASQCLQRELKTVKRPRAAVPLALLGIAASLALLSFSTACMQTRATAQPTISSPVVSHIDVSRIANERVADPQKLCDRIPEIKMFPWHDNGRGEDPVFDEIVRGGDQVVPCLIEKVTDTTPIPEFTNDDVSKPGNTFVGDIAVGLLCDITRVDLDAMIPDAFRHAGDIGGAAYYAYMKKPERRKQLQDKLWDWYHRAYQTAAQRRARAAPGEPHSGKLSAKSETKRLEEKDGQCVLVYSDELYKVRERRVSLDIAAPCEFARAETGVAELFSYADDNKLFSFWVYMVVGGPGDPSRSDQYMRNGCGTQIQALIFANGTGEVRKGAVGTGITVCPSEGVKEKVYALLAKP